MTARGTPIVRKEDGRGLLGADLSRTASDRIELTTSRELRR